jgi:hypothetical protein
MLKSVTKFTIQVSVWMHRLPHVQLAVCVCESELSLGLTLLQHQLQDARHGCASSNTWLTSTRKLDYQVPQSCRSVWP